MEGRRPPPIAEHPFPDNPVLNKFWGTPVVKPFFKTLATITIIYGTMLGVNMYLTRHEKGPFGIDITVPDEKRPIREKILELKKTTGIKNFAFKSDANTIYTLQEGKDLRFDDGLEIVRKDGILAQANVP